MRLAALERGLSVCPALRPMEKSHEPRAATCPVRAKQEVLVTPTPPTRARPATPWESMLTSLVGAASL